MHTIQITYTCAEYAAQDEIVRIPESCWIYTPTKERLTSFHWFYKEDIETSYQPNAAGNSKKKSIAIEPVDYIRETGKRYWHIQGDIPSTDPKSVFDDVEQKPLVECIDDMNREYGDFRFHCPGDSWLQMRGDFPMRFSQKPGPHGETLTSFIAKNRTSVPVLSHNVRQERVWVFKIFPKEHANMTTDDTLYIEVHLNEDKGFILENLTYYGSTDIIWHKMPDKKFSTHSRTVNDYYLLENGMFFPKTIQDATYPSGESPAKGMTHHYSITSVKINEPVDEKVFAFRIPPYVRVSIYPPVRQPDGSRYTRESVWGPDNMGPDSEPLVTFNNEKEFDTYMEAEWKKHNTFQLPEPRMSAIRLFALVAGLAMMALGLAIHFWNRGYFWNKR